MAFEAVNPQKRGERRVSVYGSPRVTEAELGTDLRTIPRQRATPWSLRRDSNPLPRPYQGRALPNELRRHVPGMPSWLVLPPGLAAIHFPSSTTDGSDHFTAEPHAGLEPATSALQVLRSTW